MKHQLRSSSSTQGRRMAGARALWVANGMKKEQLGKPIIAIVNSFTQFVPGHEIALYKLATPALEQAPEASKVIRKYNARIVEVNPVFAIVEKNGISEDITSLYEELREMGCVLQFVRSGRVAITTSCFERVNEYLADREAKYFQSKQQEEAWVEGDGTFSFLTTNPNALIIVMSIGYLPQVVSIKNAGLIKLEPDWELLNKVITIGETKAIKK